MNHHALLMNQSELPDPTNREIAWVDGVPAYQAWADFLVSAQPDLGMRQQLVRENDLMAQYGENAIDSDALRAIAGEGRLVEMGAGTGYTAKLLHDVGADVVAFDKEPSDRRVPAVPTWYPVERGAYDSVQTDGRTPLLVWPFTNAPTHWLLSDAAPDRLIVINDVAPENLSTRSMGSYHEVLSKHWDIDRSIRVSTGWRLFDDYVHFWSR